MVNLYKFGLDLLVPTPQRVYLCDLSEIFTMCWWHIEVVVNWVVEYALYSRNCKKSTLNDFFVNIYVFFTCRKFNFDHRNLKKISSDAQWNFAKDSSFRIFIWEHFLLRILQNRLLTTITCFLCSMNKRIINSSSLLPWIQKKLIFIKQ